MAAFGGSETGGNVCDRFMFGVCASKHIVEFITGVVQSCLSGSRRRKRADEEFEAKHVNAFGVVRRLVTFDRVVEGLVGRLVRGFDDEGVDLVGVVTLARTSTTAGPVTSIGGPGLLVFLKGPGAESITSKKSNICAHVGGVWL